MRGVHSFVYSPIVAGLFWLTSYGVSGEELLIDSMQVNEGRLSVSKRTISFEPESSQVDGWSIPIENFISFRTSIQLEERAWVFQYADHKNSVRILTHPRNSKNTSELTEVLVLVTGYEAHVISDTSDWKHSEIWYYAERGGATPDGSGILNAIDVETEASTAEIKYPGAFKRLSYQLGMTISEFLAVPDRKDGEGCIETRPYFSEDPFVKTYSDFSQVKYLAYRKGWQGAGVIGCKFYCTLSPAKWKDGTYERGRFEVLRGLPLAQYGANTEFYFIAPDEGKEPRLFFIETETHALRYPILKRLYTSSLGEEPKIVRRHRVQNAFGAQYENEISVWRNSVSSIELTKYDGNLEDLRIRHVLTPLYSVLNSRLQSSEAELLDQL